MRGKRVLNQSLQMNMFNQNLAQPHTSEQPKFAKALLRALRNMAAWHKKKTVFYLMKDLIL